MAEENVDMFNDELLSNELLKHLQDIPIETKVKWPRDLTALIDLYSATLIRMHYDSEEAQRITYALLADLSTYCGGRYIYLPKADALEAAIRDVKLFKDWSQRNLTPDIMAKKYKLSLQHVYRIIREQRTYHHKKVQPALFD